MNSNEQEIMKKSISKWTILKVLLSRPMIIIMLFIILLAFIQQAGEITRVMLYFFLVFYTAVAVIAFVGISDKVVLVTNQRIVLKRKRSDKNIRYVPLKHVASVEIKRGFLGSLFKFGSLDIDTTGNVSFHTLKGVSNPYEISESINERISQI